MLRVILVFCAVCLSTTYVKAQFSCGLSLRTGAGFGSKLEIVGSNPSNNTSFHSRLGSFFSFGIYGPLQLEISIGGQLYMGSGTLQKSDYSYNIARLDFESSARYQVNRLWSVASGINLTTHRDFEGLVIHRHDNLRWNGLLQVQHRFTSRLYFNLTYTRALNHLGDSYYLGTPRNSVLVGINYKIVK